MSIQVTFKAKTAYQLRAHILEVTGADEAYRRKEAECLQLINDYSISQDALQEANDALEVQQDRIGGLEGREAIFVAKLEVAEDTNKALQEANVKLDCQLSVANKHTAEGTQIINELLAEVARQTKRASDAEADCTSAKALHEAVSKGFAHEKRLEFNRGYEKACDEVEEMQYGEDPTKHTAAVRSAFFYALEQGKVIGYNDGYHKGVSEQKTENNEAPAQAESVTYTLAYNKGRNDQKAEQAQEKAYRKPTREEDFVAMLGFTEVRLVLRLDSAEVSFQPRNITRWGLSTAGDPALPMFPESNTQLGIVGILNGENVFVWDYTAWTGVA